MKLPVTEQLYQELLTLPLHPHLTDGQGRRPDSHAIFAIAGGITCLRTM